MTIETLPRGAHQRLGRYTTNYRTVNRLRDCREPIRLLSPLPKVVRWEWRIAGKADIKTLSSCRMRPEERQAGSPGAWRPELRAHLIALAIQSAIFVRPAGERVASR